MSRSTAQFITQMKLRELARQRDRLSAAYDRILRETAAHDQPRERLGQLFEGLKAIRVAGRRLHPEVANLEPLLNESSADGFPVEVASGWAEHLERELMRGRLRSEFVYLFGALLEEWGRDSGIGEGEEQRQVREEMVTFLLTTPDPNERTILSATLDSLEPQLSIQAGRVPELFEKWEYPAGDLEYTLLPRIAANPYCSPRLRGEARSFEANRLLSTELSDALDIFRSEIAEWDWPEEGVDAQVKWVQNRWRLYLEEDLPNRCLLESVGAQFGDILPQIVGDHGTIASRKERLQKVQEIDAPESIIEHELEMLVRAEEAILLDSSAPHLWGDESSELAADQDEVETNSIQALRLGELAKARAGGAGAEDAYSPGNQTHLYRVVSLIQAEIQTARAAFPDRPLTILKVDLREFYPSIPHEVIQATLERFGIPEEELGVIRRFLSPLLRNDNTETVERARRGIPLNHPLSHLLADLLMRVMERYIGAGARVRIIRLVDDICILTPYPEDAVIAWRRLQEFCTNCGLTVNLEKSGAVCLGGVLPDGLPDKAARWGLLALRSDGEWEVEESAFVRYLELGRTRWQDTPTVLGKVSVYNEAVRYLLRSLGPDTNLGERHRSAIASAVRRFHREFFGTRVGVAEALRAQIAELFSVEGSLIPEGWLYWPLTAGGLGLLNPVLMAEQYAVAFRKLEPDSAPTYRDPDWELVRNDWSLFYRQYLRPVEPQGPDSTPQSMALERDFIARGKQISAGAQETLTPYWRWILNLHGPEILNRFGTFGFLITELVPLALIRQQRGSDEALSETRAEEDGAELEDPFAD